MLPLYASVLSLRLHPSHRRILADRRWSSWRTCHARHGCTVEAGSRAVNSSVQHHRIVVRRGPTAARDAFAIELPVTARARPGVSSSLN